MAQLDEKGLRKPGWEESACAPIVLCDGQTWWFPKPLAAISPVVSEDGRVVSISRTTYGAEYDAILDRIADGDGLATFDAAIFLLRENYDLAPKDFPRLIHWFPGDPDNIAMLGEIVGVATGTPPKPSPCGDAAP